MKPVLCLGDACVDLLIPYAAALNAKSDPVNGCRHSHAQKSDGGSVANTACAIARLSVPVCFAGSCGRDAFGFEIKQHLESEGVGTDFLRLDAHLPTQLVILVLDENGDRTAFAYPPHGGSQHAILPDQLPDALIDSISWLHVSGMMLREEPAASTQLRFMKKCHDAGVPVSLDINARIESIGDSVFLRNLQTAKLYADVVFGSSADEIPLFASHYDAEVSASALAKDGTIVISRSGDQGAVLYQNDLRMHFAAFPVKVADTVGAGDTFDGAFIAARVLGYDLCESVRYANAAAAICVSGSGARSCPTREMLDAFLKTASV